MTPRQIITLLFIVTIVMIILASCSPKSYSGITYDCNGDTVSCMVARFKILDGSKPCGKMVTFKATVNRKKINAKRIN